MSMYNINLMLTLDVNMMLTIVTKLSPMVNSQLVSTVDIILMAIQYFIPTGDASGKMSALYLVLIIYLLP